MSIMYLGKPSAELQVLQGNNRFTNNLYQLLSRQEGNVFFSPISAHAVLAMAFQGAQGSTEDAFKSVLNISKSKIAAKGYNKIMSRLNSVKKVTLHLANKIFLEEGNELLADFKNSVSKNFFSDVQLVDFAQSSAAAKLVNNWVKEKTENKIRNLLDPSALGEDTRLVLVNAIYFKGDWLYQFDKNLTSRAPFYLNDKHSVTVDMMHIRRKYIYSESEQLGAKVLQLPYKGKNLSMIIILPKERNGIKDLEQKLANVNLGEILQNSYRVEVWVWLPKFKIEVTINLEDTLSELGLGEIFDKQKANFRGMIPMKPNKNLYVSKVVQKAFIEVNEEGAKAAAATALRVMEMGDVPPLMVFFVDHPCIFILSENSKNVTPLFVGRLSEPNYE